MILADGLGCRPQVHRLDSAGREATHMAELLRGATGSVAGPNTVPEKSWAVRPLSPSRPSQVAAALAGLAVALAARRALRKH